MRHVTAVTMLCLVAALSAPASSQEPAKPREMTPEELIQVKAFVSLTQKQQQEKTDKKKKDGTTNDTPKTD